MRPTSTSRGQDSIRFGQAAVVKAVCGGLVSEKDDVTGRQRQCPSGWVKQSPCPYSSLGIRVLGGDCFATVSNGNWEVIGASLHVSANDHRPPGKAIVSVD